MDSTVQDNCIRNLVKKMTKLVSLILNMIKARSTTIITAFQKNETTIEGHWLVGSIVQDIYIRNLVEKMTKLVS